MPLAVRCCLYKWHIGYPRSSHQLRKEILASSPPSPDGSPRYHPRPDLRPVRELKVLAEIMARCGRLASGGIPGLAVAGGVSNGIRVPNRSGPRRHPSALMNPMVIYPQGRETAYFRTPFCAFSRTPGHLQKQRDFRAVVLATPAHGGPGSTKTGDIFVDRGAGLAGSSPGTLRAFKSFPFRTEPSNHIAGRNTVLHENCLVPGNISALKKLPLDDQLTGKRLNERILERIEEREENVAAKKDLEEEYGPIPTLVPNDMMDPARGRYPRDPYIEGADADMMKTYVATSSWGAGWMRGNGLIERGVQLLVHGIIIAQFWGIR
ncbi:uncharacterized protein NECHADRAFT_74108 [Fusarium vanettenii 77-13-4]|uniref:Uncharacterized protein n=1 Tax=Fusarium vanettenii (strain ATCC MYA-4622 / CBS 123669 / FGSC 9596 / NRRL 45880 / 77-13-4) TaxID=660122 RepID=C7YVX3_FUSV7|nr:uncharacterized protein NECHADRAFT_74108 [Fusarium vanettenii 77-13-4]EEU44077.1 predicted protein [Fusarium vanettenii 77-13-4]